MALQVHEPAILERVDNGVGGLAPFRYRTGCAIAAEIDDGDVDSRLCA